MTMFLHWIGRIIKIINKTMLYFYLVTLKEIFIICFFLHCYLITIIYYKWKDLKVRFILYFTIFLKKYFVSIHLFTRHSYLAYFILFLLVSILASNHDWKFINTYIHITDYWGKEFVANRYHLHFRSLTMIGFTYPKFQIQKNNIRPIYINTPSVPFYLSILEKKTHTKE